MQEPGLAGGYDAFLEAAREVERIIRARVDTTEDDLAEGYLYLAGMWNFHLERVFKGYDVDRPCFVRVMDSHRSWGFPTPDHHYFSAQIDGSGEYRITGTRGNTVDYCFEVLSGLVGDDGVVGRRIDALEASNMHLEADGRYELSVGGSPRPMNWLRAGNGARTIFVRQTSNDWRTEAATPMLIERVDRPLSSASDPRPSAAAVQALFHQAARNLVDQVRFLDTLSQQWKQTLPVNELPPPAVGPADAGYFPGQYNTKCRFVIRPDEALIVTLAPCTALCQSLALGHPLWFNSLHPRSTQSTLNRAQSVPSDDGVLRYVISAQDPGVMNWLDTAGQTEGFLFLRYQRVMGAAPAQPGVQLMPLSALKAEGVSVGLRADAADRQHSLRTRRLSLDRRFF